MCVIYVCVFIGHKIRQGILKGEEEARRETGKGGGNGIHVT